MKKAIVYLNMGAPHNLDEVELFLKNMFNDKNIITVKSNLIRSLIASIIVFFRKKEAKENYKKLGGISPLIKHTESFLKLSKKIYPNYESVCILRYTPPFAKDVLKELKQKDVKELIVIPLYPQYSTTTTKSSLEDLQKWLKKLDYKPKLKIIEKFYQEDFYLDSVIEDIKKYISSYDSKEFDLVFSAHSLPQKIIDAGDSYQKEIEDSVKLLKEKLKKSKIEFKNICLAYQSKLGPIKWLEPTLEDTLIKLKKDKKILIYPLSFILDNSETEFELSIEYKEMAKKLGYEKYIVSSCINSKESFIRGLSKFF